MSIVYWKTKDGRLVSVDDMDTNHVRNAFKFLIKRHNILMEKLNNKSQIGEMAQEFNDSHMSDENDDRFLGYLFHDDENRNIYP